MKKHVKINNCPDVKINEPIFLLGVYFGKFDKLRKVGGINRVYVKGKKESVSPVNVTVLR